MTKQSQRGLTLIELCIVLGIMALVGGAIWATSTAVREKTSIQESVQLVTEIATNVRGVYTGFPNAPAPNLQNQIDRGMFPISVVNETKDDTINAWGGTIRLTFPVGRLTGFSVVFNLPVTVNAITRQEACMGMATRLPGSATINPATGGAWAIAGTLPSGGVPARDPTQGLGPSLVLINTGAWENVTGESVDAVDWRDCEGFAFYYRL